MKYLLTLVVAMSAFSVSSCTAPGKPHEEEMIAENVTDFPSLYANNCAGCHGAEGKNGPGRILNDSLYLSFIPKAELKKVLIYGRAGTAMPAWSKAQGGPLVDHQIDVLVNGIYDSWARPFDAHGEAIPAYSASVESGDAANGKKLFSRSCFMCHGPGAPVGVVTSRSYLDLVSNQMLRTSIVVGRPDLGMPNYQHLKLGKALTDGDVTDLVAYLASLRPSPAPGQSMRTNESTGGSGNGPGSPTDNRNEGTKHGNSSQSGGTIEKKTKDMK